MKALKILIVDDERISRFNIKVQLDKSYLIFEADNFNDAKKIIEKEILDICFIDLNLDNSSKLLGLELISLTASKGIYPVVMSSHSTDAVIKEAYDLGCKDYYCKGNEKDNVVSTINRFFMVRDSFTEKNLLSEFLPTKNVEQQKIYNRLIPVLKTNFPICILGETGTGKTYMAETIHRTSRCEGPFISINCAAIQDSLLESELFGHVKGAFTGASEPKQGVLARANNGTLHLDEVGAMSLSMQSKLLTAIESGEFYPVGSDKKVKSKFRLISSTQDDIEALILAKKFKFDLYQRICGFTIRLLPMRQRKEDILPVLKSQISLNRRIVFSPEAKELIENYRWPGNLRELVRFSDLISMTGAGVIGADEVKLFFEDSKNSEKELVSDNDYERMIEVGGLNPYLEEVAKAMMEKAYKKNGNKVRNSCADLKITYKRFYRYFNKDFDTFSVPLSSENGEHLNELH